MSSRERRSRRAVADARMRLGGAEQRTRASDVINHYINVSDADLTEREVAGDLEASAIFRLEHRRLLAAARTCERAAGDVGTAGGRLRDGVCRRERRAHGLIEARSGVNQFARVGVRRGGEQGGGLADLDDAPAI